MSRIVIIGNGIAGITTARHVRKLSSHDITVISAETDHHFSRTALMYIYMGHMKFENTKPYEDWFWEKNRINLVRGFVEKIDTDQKALSLQGGLMIDIETHKTVLNTKSIDLTVKEFELLSLFMRHPGRAFSRAELLDLIWGHNFNGFEHTVNSHIN